MRPRIVSIEIRRDEWVTSIVMSRVLNAFAFAARRFWLRLKPETRRAFKSVAIGVPCLLAFVALVSATPAPGIIVAIAACMYFWPTMAAIGRNHDTIAGIFVLNLLLGWTVIGWIVAMVWACSRPRLPA